MPKKNKGLNWAVVLFMFTKLILGVVIFFTSLRLINESPYREIASILGIIVSLTSGVRITLSNFFKDWTSQD
ncbi:hypothetical protein J4217_03580 [Candidatus Pacearchaeota archaeon]|nr:hypothetical protein [uncultured archaeon]MBS3091500.1 hypothetical protein [Candidatus Pacearchaeota archaeon]